MMGHWRILLVALLSASLTGWVWSQETKKSAEKATTKTTTKSKDATEDDDKPSGRLPNNFGKLDLTEKQKTDIYKLQADYSSQIDELEKKLDELKLKRDDAIQGVLTVEQKSKLKSLQAETAKKSAAKKSTSKAKSTEKTEKTDTK